MGITLVGFVVTYIAHIAALAGASYVLAGLVLVVLFGCLFLGLRFSVAIGVAALLIAAHFVTGLVVGLPWNVLSYMTAILGGAAAIGGITTYNLEFALRTNYLETRLLNELAERDGMTGLYNRRIFDDYMRRIWRQSRREGIAVAIVFVDIDFFKIFNDLYGHQAGDDCLKKVATCIARGAKRRVMAARSSCWCCTLHRRTTRAGFPSRSAAMCSISRSRTRVRRPASS